MQIACCVPKATNTPLEHVILLAFPLQQWLHKCFVIRTVRVLLELKFKR
jgi:hypothetical protein